MLLWYLIQSSHFGLGSARGPWSDPSAFCCCLLSGVVALHSVGYWKGAQEGVAALCVCELCTLVMELVQDLIPQKSMSIYVIYCLLHCMINYSICLYIYIYQGTRSCTSWSQLQLSEVGQCSIWAHWHITFAPFGLLGSVQPSDMDYFTCPLSIVLAEPLGFQRGPRQSQLKACCVAGTCLFGNDSGGLCPNKRDGCDNHQPILNEQKDT